MRASERASEREKCIWPAGASREVRFDASTRVSLPPPVRRWFPRTSRRSRAPVSNGDVPRRDVGRQQSRVRGALHAECARPTFFCLRRDCCPIQAVPEDRGTFYSPRRGWEGEGDHLCPLTRATVVRSRVFSSRLRQRRYGAPCQDLIPLVIRSRSYDTNSPARRCRGAVNRG